MQRFEVWSSEHDSNVFGARQAVAEQLIEAGLDELAHDVQLVVSELTTNALLHGAMPVRVWLAVSPDLVRVEVHDRSKRRPLRPEQRDDALTGRGMLLVEAVARRWGVEVTDHGKVVWAELTTAPASALPYPVAGDVDHRERWEGEGEASEWGTHDAARYPVRLGHIPTRLLLEAKAHVDNLVRELTLATTPASHSEASEVPAHLAELTAAVVHGFSAAREEIKRQALEAAARGDEHVVLDLRLPLEAAQRAKEYLYGIDAADAYSRAARLLTLESPPQHRLFRHWYVEEVIKQLEQAAGGHEPAPPQSFEQRLLEEMDSITRSQHVSDRAARMYAVAAALVRSRTTADVADAVLSEGVAALRASGGGLLMPTGRDLLDVPGTVGYAEDVVARLRSESRNAELPAAVALRSGEAVWLESREERDRRFPELVGLEPQTVSVCAVPLEVDGQRLGALRFSFNERRLFDADERSFVLALAAQTAQALDRARLFQHSRVVAETLQAGLLPPAVPTIPGLSVAATYEPLGDGLDVGGDFYDIWPLPGNRWALAIGDVCGTGASAATLTGLVRHTLRARTMTDEDPAEVLNRLNGALLSGPALGADDERFCTALLAIVTPSTSGGEVRATIRLANGGHPYPLLLQPGGQGEVRVDGSLLGVLEDPVIVTSQLTLRKGDALVLYTDGVLDTRAPDAKERFGEERLARAATGATAEEIVESIRTAVLGFGGGRLNDDVAILAVAVK